MGNYTGFSFAIKNEWSSYIWGFIIGYLGEKFIDRILIPRIIQYGPNKLATYTGIYSAAFYSFLLIMTGAVNIWRQIMLEAGYPVFLYPPVTENGYRVLLQPLPYEIILPFGLCLVCGIFLMVAVCLYVRQHRSSEIQFTPLFS